jgi:hypothetical protein
MGGLKWIYGIFAVGIFFGAGILVGSKYPAGREGDDAVERVQKVRGRVEEIRQTEERFGDRLKLSQSSTAASALAESLADPKLRSELEKKLREVPFAVLKQIYLERQDAQWEHLQERYPQPKEMNDEEIGRRTDALFESFRKNAGENSYFIARGEWRLRGGKSAPYVVLVEYYSSRSESGGLASLGRSSSTDGPSASNGRELCYVSTLYLRTGEKFSSDGQSSCITWVPMRGELPFAVHSNYNAKRLVPYFDSIAVALPGFGGDAASEWYDAGSDRWASLGRVRFDPVSRDEFVSFSKETQVESGTN